MLLVATPLHCRYAIQSPLPLLLRFSAMPRRHATLHATLLRDVYTPAPYACCHSARITLMPRRAAAIIRHAARMLMLTRCALRAVAADDIFIADAHVPCRRSHAVANVPHATLITRCFATLLMPLDYFAVVSLRLFRHVLPPCHCCCRC